jgi:hypothetical protein
MISPFAIATVEGYQRPRGMKPTRVQLLLR